MKRSTLLLALALCALAPQIAAAESDLGLKHLGATVGFVNAEDLDGTFSFGAIADLGTITPPIGLETRLDYWSRTEDIGGGGEVSIRDIAIGARGKYYFPLDHPTIRPFAGAGLGIHFLHSEVSIPAYTVGPITYPAMNVEDSTTRLGLDLGGGMLTAINPKTDFLAELWYGIVSDVNQLSLRVGVQFALGS